MIVRVYDNRNRMKEVKSDGKFVYNDRTKSDEYNAKYNKYINEIQPQMGEINFRGRDLHSMYEGPLNFTYQSEPIDVSRDLWSNNTITNIKRNDGTENTLYSLKTSGVTDSDIFDNEEFYIHDTHPLAKELGIEWRDNNGNPITPNNDFLNRINNINKQYPTSQYDNGGVLDATYNEQINRIRQSRFAGWRFKDGGIHIKESNRGKFTEQANNAGMGVQEFAKHVLANKDNYSSTTIKRANFARNATKFNH